MYKKNIRTEGTTAERVAEIHDIVERLGVVMQRLPDWRLTQLFCNLQRACGNDCFYREDGEFIELLEAYCDHITIG